MLVHVCECLMAYYRTADHQIVSNDFKKTDLPLKHDPTEYSNQRDVTALLQLTLA